jgi:hypothetical protein
VEEDLRRVKPLWIAVLATADIVSVGICIERILGIDLVGTVIALILYEDVGHIVLLVPVLTLLASLWHIKLTYDQRTLARELAGRARRRGAPLRDRQHRQNHGS